jgi:type I restriction enzyme S subunit
MIGDVTRVVGGGTPKTSDLSNFAEHGFPWLTPADLSAYKAIYVSEGRRDLSEKGLNESSAVLLPKGTVLFTSRAPFGYVAIAANELATNQGFRSFICH